MSPGTHVLIRKKCLLWPDITNKCMTTGDFIIYKKKGYRMANNFTLAINDSVREGEWSYDWETRNTLRRKNQRNNSVTVRSDVNQLCCFHGSVAS